ncbi:colicin-E1-like [Tripterygium wilfordii]|uniref:colicin-E1-like n=1 Tax=Tripterygium wilfordii TaxID=458696 RepID=UPI0018F7F724|nr:colicin-E1-like [Tripterygium wilfordii]
MSPQMGIVNKTHEKRARRSSSKTRNPNRRRRTAGLKHRRPEMAEKSARRASSESLNLEEITAFLTRLEAEMAERKPQRGSSKRKFLKKSLVALKRLERGGAELRARIRLDAEYQEKELKELEAEEKEMADERVMNEEIRVLNEWLATAIHADGIQEPVFAGRLKM